MTIDPTRQPGIRIAQIIVERASFSHRDDYLRFEPTTFINVEGLSMQLEFGLARDQRSGFVRMRVRPREDTKPMYEFDVAIVGLVELDPQQRPNMTVQEYLATSGAALLYPFAREVVASMTGRGRFGPLWLAPLNLVAALGQAEPAAAADKT